MEYFLFKSENVQVVKKIFCDFLVHFRISLNKIDIHFCNNTKAFLQLCSHIPTKIPVKSSRENFSIVVIVTVTLTGRNGPEPIYPEILFSSTKITLGRFTGCIFVDTCVKSFSL